MLRSVVGPDDVPRLAPCSTGLARPVGGLSAVRKEEPDAIRALDPEPARPAAGDHRHAREDDHRPARQDLRKIARIAVLNVDLQPEQPWCIGAAPVSGVGGHLDILLSDHINTDKEKAAFIAHAYDALGQALGQLASVFYVAVHEIPALAWDARASGNAARAVFDRFAAADACLFSVPMWNTGVPYVLKQWIDIVSQPGWLFSFTPDAGYRGLIRGKKAAVIYTSGVYQPAAQQRAAEIGSHF